MTTPKPARGLGAKFWRLWQASFASNLADGVWLTAGPLLATTLTRDPLLIAGRVTYPYINNRAIKATRESSNK